MIDRFMPYLNYGNLVEKVVASNGRDTYLMPSRRNGGHVAVVLIREIVSPTVFRNAEKEVTEIEDRCGVRRVRATPSKFKFGERGRGLLVLRAWEVGGRLPQNRTAVGEDMPIRECVRLEYAGLRRLRHMENTGIAGEGSGPVFGCTEHRAVS